MIITGTNLQGLQVETGTGQKGVWKKRQYIIETTGDNPKKICITAWNKAVDAMDQTIGSEVEAYVNIESREYNGKWYTDISVWKVKVLGEAQPQNSESSDDETLPF